MSAGLRGACISRSTIPKRSRKRLSPSAANLHNVLDDWEKIGLRAHRRDTRYLYTFEYVSSNAAQPGTYRIIRSGRAGDGRGNSSYATRSGYIAGGESRPIKDEGTK